MLSEEIAGGPDVTRDSFLGGAVEAVQPARGHHRAGMEAVLLASALPSDFSGTVVDLGAGAGVAGLCAVAAHGRSAAVLVERDPALLACARATLALPSNRAIAGRVRVVALDIAGPASERARAGLPRGTADAVMVNPPFHAPGSVTPSPWNARAAAHVLSAEGLKLWFDVAAECLRPGGELIGIGPGGDRAAILACAAGAFGRIDLLPVLPRENMPARRILYRARPGTRGETRILPPLVMHAEAGGGFRPEVERILRHGAPLGVVHPAWAAGGNDVA